MRTVGTVAFWGQFEACFSGAYELHFGLRREHWGSEGQRDKTGLKTLAELKPNGSNVRSKIRTMQEQGEVAARLEMWIVQWLHTHHCKNLVRCQ